MPTGLFNSPSLDGPAVPAPVPLSQSQPRAAVNYTFSVKLTADNVPQNLVAFFVPPGLAVTVRGAISTAKNANDVRVALHPEELLQGGGVNITPDTEINFPVDNTGQIWVIGKTGDGVTARISGVPIF